MHRLMGINPCDESLACSLLIARRPIHLPCEEEPLHHLALQRMVELCGIKEVVLDGIAWAVQTDVPKGGYLTKSLQLHLEGQGGGEAIDIIFVGTLPLGL